MPILRNLLAQSHQAGAIAFLDVGIVGEDDMKILLSNLKVAAQTRCYYTRLKEW
ncbi:hypothetical protein [Nostoc sp. C110]|uniref:hypothetical protein n=1 Tax=Nostoc sp. C110 TaxID=3349876 RepID=UPI00370D8BAA